MRRRKAGNVAMVYKEQKGKRIMTGFHYVYMLSDVATHTHHYVGMTQDLKTRLEKHNSGQVPPHFQIRPMDR